MEPDIITNNRLNKKSPTKDYELEATKNGEALMRCRKSEFRWGERTYVMGIITVSPDSFSGDGLTNAESALVQARRMVSEGADILDIGGESTRPGAPAVELEDELARVIPAIQQIAVETTVPISVDSTKYEVIRQALEAGAAIINDQWGLKKEPRIADLAAKTGVPLILMSNQRDKGGYDATIKRDTAYYDDIIREVISSLLASISLAEKAGVSSDKIIIDPGLGFGKTWQFDMEIIRRLEELKTLDKPILVGPSRKSFIKIVLDLPANQRVEGTAAAVAIAISKGADIVRVHDVKEMVRVCRVSDAIMGKFIAGS
jgi:dihydropteroate synthase